MAEYPKTAVNKLGRLPKRGAYDYAQIHSFIDTAPVLHVSFNDPEHPYPVVLPMLGVTGNYQNQSSDKSTETQDIYLHGWVSNRLMRSASSPDSPGLPITIAASHLDGLVLALSPFHHSCNYRSAIAYGHAKLVEDEAEKIYGMERITDNMLTNRWADSRSTPTATEIKSTSILRVSIDSASAKIRSGGPHEDRHDLDDGELRAKTWTGVVPCWLQYGEPVAADENKAGGVPESITKWVGEQNEKGRVGAYEQMKEEGMTVSEEVIKGTQKQTGLLGRLGF